MIHDEQYIDDLFTVRSTSATTATIGVWDASLLNSIKALKDPDLSSIPADQSLVTRERLIDLHMQTYRAMKRLFIQ